MGDNLAFPFSHHQDGIARDLLSNRLCFVMFDQQAIESRRMPKKTLAQFSKFGRAEKVRMSN